MKYPIGIQTFEKIREEGFVYVDKTRLVYQLAENGGFYFLSRPRRFGKSLLISTLEAYFEGKRELFTGLAMEKLEREWTEYPVLQLDLNTIEAKKDCSLDDLLNSRLCQWEELYKVKRPAQTNGVRFANVIRAAYENTGRQVVVLIDEYDKPLLANIERSENLDVTRGKLKALYSVLKSEDRYIRFALLTGVTRFSKVSVFSDLNNLNDISMDLEYSEICGITEKELHDTFDAEVEVLAEANKITKEACYAELNKSYDGYHFTYGAEGMYNPFSILHTLLKKRFGNYWFNSGTPTFLLEVMKRTGFDFANGLSTPVSAAELGNIDSIDRSPLPLLFQAGYLTLKSYDPDFETYTLDYPNEEVRKSFIEFLVPYYCAAGPERTATLQNLVRAVRSGNTDVMHDCLRTFFDSTGNCMLYEKKSKERDFRNAVYVVFNLLGFYTEAELSASGGRMDVCCQTKDYVYVIELKMDQSAQKALDQIEKKGYALRFAGDPRRLFKIGVNFSSKSNRITGWKVYSRSSLGRI